MSKSPGSKPSAPKCPACRRELSPVEASLAQCPHCGSPLSAPPSGGAPDSGRATVSGIGQTIDLSDLEFDAGSPPSAGPPTGKVPPGQPAPGSQTIDESQQRQTVDERSLPPKAKTPPGSQTIDDRAIGQTLDEDAVRALSQ